MPSVFHYTDSAGLLGILKSQSLFATDYRYLNDASEGSMIRDLILSVFEQELAGIMPELVKRGSLTKGFYEFHGARGNWLQAEGIYKGMVNTMEVTSPLFVLSFCRHEEPATPSNTGCLVNGEHMLVLRASR